MNKKLNFYEQTKLINKIEREFNLETLVYKNINIWPILKIQILCGAISLNKKDKPKKTNSTAVQDINALNQHKDNLLSTLNLCDKIIETSKNINNIIFLADATYRYEKVDEKSFHRFSDSLSHYLREDYTTITLEYTTSIYHQDIYTKNNHFYIDKIIQLSKVENSLNLLKNNILNIPFIIPTNLKKFEKYLDKEYNLYFTRQLSSLLKEFEFILALKKNFLLLFKKINPQIVFLTRYFTPVEMALILAAKEANIPSIDIQHGLITSEHLFYCHWDNIYNKQYELLPSYFWVWDDYTYNLMQNWFKDTNHKIIKAGHIWFSYYKDFIYQNSDNANVSSKNNVLFTLQPIEDCFPIYLINTIIKTKNCVNWFIRLHPSHPAMKIYEPRVLKILHSLKDSGISIEWENSTKVGLYDLFKDIDIILSIYSSTSYEAYEFGILPILISPNTYTNQNHAINNKTFKYASTEEELIKLLSKKNKTKKTKVVSKIYQNKNYLIKQIKIILKNYS